MKVLMGAAAALLLCGCTSFNREWSAAVKADRANPPSDLSGPWAGRWISDANGHHGKLRCVITKKTGDEYDADFRATYEHVLHFSYTVPLKVHFGASGYVFSGEADLGKIAGGVYTYEGAADSTNFISTYSSKYDHGKFELSRPGEK